MIYFNEQEAIENGAIYKKSCFICNREYFSTSRNAKYCCEECREKSLVKINKRNKTRRIRRKEYDANKEINRALSKAYALAHDVADLYKIPKVCAYKDLGLTDECSGTLELHHQNSNPFDNSPTNLFWLCSHHHSKAHTETFAVNIVEMYNRCLDDAGFSEEEDKYKVMIERFKEELHM